MAVGVQKAWSTTAASNAGADSNINYAEGMAPASLNDSARAQMAALKGFANQITGAKTSGGSANVQTLTSDSAAAISTAYAAGMAFVFKAGYTNSGATTFNVDGVGAKSIKKGGAQAALAANDIVAGGVYFVAYEASGDCFILLNPETGISAAQPLDATLTALGALSWSSGAPLVQFTAADTVSLTLTPIVSSVTASQGAAATTPSGTLTNTTDNASVLAAKFEGDRATPANNDEVYTPFYLSDSGGTQVEVGRVTARATSVTAGSVNSRIGWSNRLSGTLALRLILDGLNLYPNTNDGIALGAAGAAFADLFLASGGVINANSGNATIAHVTGGWEVTGTFRGRLPTSAETSGTLTSATSANKVVAASGNITLNGNVFADGDYVVIYAGASARTLTQGSTGSPTQRLHGSSTTGNLTLAARGMAQIYFVSATEWICSGDVA